ncbi:MAG: type II secretion system protein GspE [Candidatus Omnitrophota bacterium]|jgi:type IV pilus assembly protein PilB|nr:MAG: type II secretion system protein GspE [Candidatus Omnitrophota bacterium]
MKKVARERLGDILVESGRLTESQLKAALAQQAPRQKLGQVIRGMGLLTEQEIAEILSEQLRIPCMSSDNFLIDPQVIEFIPERLARRHNVVPLFLVENELTVAMSDPLDLVAVDELQQESGYRINCVLSTESAINRALDEYYSVAQSIQDVIAAFEGDAPRTAEDSAPAVRIVNQMLFQAVKLNASDIHVEHGEHACRIRFRIDGILHEILTPPIHLGAFITSRLKIMANLDISEKRLPQDGRFSITVGKRLIDVRVSTLPTTYGEKVVLRILDKSSMQIGLDHIGLDAEETSIIEKLLLHPYGMLLVTGPTGSGKSTTLYGMLRHLSSPEKNIVTIEDPVEYKFDDINQMQVNTKVNLTFARGLRAILRQDPDVIMVGEIRDEETASIAVRSALTGHFVLSTLHTNDVVSTIGRMIDMQVAPYLLASSIVGVISQRLVRTVCKDCVQYIEPDAATLAKWEIKPAQVQRWAKIRGCERCNHSGYKGRTAIFEILAINDAIRQMIIDSKSSVEIREVAKRSGLSMLRTVGMKKVFLGITTIDELERVTVSIEE